MKAAFLVAATLVVACSSNGSPSDAGDEASSDAPVQTDAGGDGATTLAHYDTCTSDAQCPSGDSCSVPATTATDPTAPKQCRPSCNVDPDCTATLSAITPSAMCNPTDKHCTGTCGVGPPCNPPYTCHVFSGQQDGYCVK